MDFIVYDTETTGLYKTDEVIQFAGILTDSNFAIKNVYNFYCDTVVPVHPEALALHHLDHKKLSVFSHGTTFEDNFLKLPFLQSRDLTWVGYNNWGADERFINQTLMNNGLPPVNFGKRVSGIKDVRGHYTLDLMHSVSNYCNGGIKMKLINALATIDKYTTEQLDAVYNKYFLGFDSVNPEGVMQHNALYDAFLTWVLLSYYGPRLVI